MQQRICQDPDCGRTAFARGYCNPCYLRLRRCGELPIALPRDPMERFWRNVNQTETCWRWTGSKTANGYGRFTAVGVAAMAHRFAYERLVGPIPANLELDHLCRVRDCVNPAHLEPVTRLENNLRSTNLAAQNHKKHSCPRGHRYDVVYPNGARGCRECDRKKSRDAQRRRRNAST